MIFRTADFKNYVVCPSQLQNSSARRKKVGTKNSSLGHSLLPSLMGSNKRDRLWTPGFPIHKIYVTNQFLVLQSLDEPKSMDEK